MNEMKNKKGQTEAGVLLFLFLILVVGVVIVLLLGFDQVEPSHLGVKVKFGQIIGVMHPSLQWTGLFVDVFQYDLRTRKAEIELVGDNYAPTKDGQKIFSLINVNYRVKKSDQTIQDLYANVGSDDVISDRLNINAIVVEGFKQATAGYTAMEILEKRQEVKDRAIENIKKNFPEQYFEIENIVITNIAFSKAYADEIEAKQIALQTAQKEENNLATVKFQQQQEIEKYKAEAEKIKLQAQQLTDLTIKQAWISKWSGNLPQYMIMSPETANFLLQLPTTQSVTP